MLDKEQEPKKKKKGLLPKMGLDEGSVAHAPSAPQPGIIASSPEEELNQRSRDEAVGTKIQDKLSKRPDGR
jgi:hypothetical protein